MNPCAGETREFFRRRSVTRLDGTLLWSTSAESKLPSSLQGQSLDTPPARAQGTGLSG